MRRFIPYNQGVAFIQRFILDFQFYGGFQDELLSLQSCLELLREKIKLIENQWLVYIIRTSKGHLYTGITTDMPRRLEEHHGSSKGAKSLRGKGPFLLEKTFPVEDRSIASKLESRIKQLSKAQKELLIQGKLPVDGLLSEQDL